MMSYFEYLAEQQKSEKQNMYFGFEEPETFLHPSAQENLFQKLKELCGNDYQVIISTHSPIIVAKTDMKDIIHIVKENGQFSILPTNLKSIAQDLGITVDNQFISLFENAKLLFLVEGIDDANAFNHVSALYKKNGEIDATLKDLGAVSIPAGGCGSVKHWVTLNLLNTLNKPCFIFQDADISSPTETSKNKVLLEELGFVEGRDFLVSQKRELENYIPCDALNRLVPEAKLSYGDYDDVKKICKVNAFAGKLGGGNVLEKYFESLNYADVKKAFFDGNEDEFLKIYTLIKAKL